MSCFGDRDAERVVCRMGLGHRPSVDESTSGMVCSRSGSSDRLPGTAGTGAGTGGRGLLQDGGGVSASSGEGEGSCFTPGVGVVTGDTIETIMVLARAAAAAWCGDMATEAGERGDIAEGEGRLDVVEDIDVGRLTTKRAVSTFVPMRGTTLC